MILRPPSLKDRMILPEDPFLTKSFRHREAGRRPLEFMLNPTRFGGSRDPYFSSVVLLLRGNGAAGSTTFTDSSSYNRATAAVKGNVQHSSAQSKFYSTSIAFDGAGDLLEYAWATALTLPGDMTIETWMYPTAITGILVNMGGGINLGWPAYQVNWDYSIGTPVSYNFGGSTTGSSQNIGSETGITSRLGNPILNTWNHLAVTRIGNIWRGFHNGTKNSELTVSGTPYNSSPRGLQIGGRYDNTWGTVGANTSITGYLQELRLTNGVGRYSDNFTPPAAPFGTS